MTMIMLREVEVDGACVDVVIDDGRITHIGPSLPVPSGAEIVAGGGGALIPGLWDHHIHLVALAASRRSVHAGPPDVRTLDQLAVALRAASSSRPGSWIRAVGYHESVAGELDRDGLDQLVPAAPVRLQHRSGAMWILNSAAIDRLGVEGEPHPGAERDRSGRLTGRLYGADRWLRERLQRTTTEPPPDLAAVGRELAGYGVTGVTDATPYEHLADLDLLAHATKTGALPQRVVAMGGPALAGARLPAPLEPGPVKLLLADHALPSLDQLVEWVTVAHASNRPIAAHCVTRASLVLALTAIDLAGAAPGDRIEHGAVVPPELRERLVEARLTVVTQPNFVAERGDQYLTDVDADDRPHLYPCRSLIDGGIPVAGSTDAPFGHPDPWRAIAAAVDRRTAGGRSIGEDEAVSAPRALQLFVGPPDDPGRHLRSVTVGSTADLCLLRAPLRDVLRDPSAAAVRVTLAGGRIVHGGEDRPADQRAD